MEVEFRKNNIKMSKELTNLDLFVKRFITIVEKLKIDYVVISGYISIVFGRSRETEDVDMIIEPIDKNKFNLFWKALQGKYECVNTDNFDEAFDYLQSNLALRFYENGSFIPNMEIKFKKSTTDEFSLKNKVRVIIDGFEFNTSLLELQIAYKLFMSSEKDIEDAKFLYNLFKSYLNKDMLMELLDDFDAKKNFELIK